MEVKEWSYEEYPSFDEPIDGVERIPTTGDEKGAYIFSNVEYAHVDGITLHLQIIVPRTRNTTDSDETYPCIVYVQLSIVIPGLRLFRHCLPHLPEVSVLSALR
jgi:hypothetical protein